MSDNSLSFLNSNITSESSKLSMEKIQEYLSDASFHKIKILSIDVLMKVLHDEEYKNSLYMYDDILIEDSEVWDILDIDNNKKRQEIERRTFISSLMRYLITMNTRIYLLFDNMKTLKATTDKISRTYKNLNVIGTDIIDLNEEEKVNLLNDINGNETRIIMSMCQADFDEKFLADYEKMIGASIWLSLKPDFWVSDKITVLNYIENKIKIAKLKKLLRS